MRDQRRPRLDAGAGQSGTLRQRLAGRRRTHPLALPSETKLLDAAAYLSLMRSQAEEELKKS